VVLVVIAAAFFVSEFIVFPAIYIPTQHDGGLVTALDVDFGLIAPIVFVVSLVARYKARRIIRDDLAAGTVTLRSVRNSEPIALALALIAGIPAAIGIFIAIFLLIALSASGV
jgi:hypothetical protein